MRKLSSKITCTILLGMLALPGCDNNDPGLEEVPEMITEVTLVFKTDNGSTTVSVTAEDPDGDGPQDMIIGYPVDLTAGKEYTLDILLSNGLASPPVDISAEVAAEGTDHMFFFEWSDDLFSDPAGNGNIDNRADPVNYVGEYATDANGLPLGLGTEWTTGAEVASGQFRVMLKHLPGLKTATSGSDVGETDIDVVFDVVVH
jgi:hypothetical protein